MDDTGKKRGRRRRWVLLLALLLLALVAGAVAWWMYARSAAEVRRLQGEATRQAQEIARLEQEQDDLLRRPQPQATEERPAVTETPAGMEEELDRLVLETSTLRGLSLTERVGREWMSKEGLRAYLEQHFAEEYPQAEAEVDAQVMALLGLLEPGTDLYHLLLDLYTEQVAGFYDPKAGRMYLVAEALGPMEKLVFVHEYVHALQDRLFGLGTQLDALKADDDRALALEALAEGDATLLMEQYLLAHMAELMTPDLLDQVYGIETPLFDAAPYAVRQQLMFPYEAGFLFAWTLYDEGGWAGIDAAWKDPPHSSEQILHPERYPDDSPQAVSLPPLTATLGAGWRLRGQDTLGEFMLRLHLEAYLDQADVDRAATGWDGDRYALYERDGEPCLVIALIWDDAEEAGEFVEVYQNLAGVRYGTAGKGAAGEGMWWAGRSGLYLKWQDNRVWLVLTPERSTAEAVARELR
ncbi:MAG: hypothetical protein ACPL7G_06395 [Chloroflexia bacterium]